MASEFFRILVVAIIFSPTVDSIFAEELKLEYKWKMHKLCNSLALHIFIHSLEYLIKDILYQKFLSKREKRVKDTNKTTYILKVPKNLKTLSNFASNDIYPIRTRCSNTVFIYLLRN